MTNAEVLKGVKVGDTITRNDNQYKVDRIATTDGHKMYVFATNGDKQYIFHNLRKVGDNKFEVID